MATGSKLLKKLTLRTFIGSKADILAYALTGRMVAKGKDGKDVQVGSTGEPVPLMRVLGNVTGYRTGQSDFGEYAELKGNFHATNLQTGEILEDCTKCILPGVVGDSVASAMAAGAESVQFAIELDARYSEKAATMYEFDARTLVKPQTPKPINDLMARLQQEGIEMTKPLALKAPVLTEAQKEAQAAAEKKADEDREAKAKTDAAPASTKKTAKA
jgi:hypothetical protein